MRKILFSCLFLLFQLSMSQEVIQEKININFQDRPVIEVLEEIEKQSSYKFFFLEEWLKDYRVSGQFENAELENVLSHIFRSTLINFYQIDGERIILTKNNVIYNEVGQSLLPSSAEGEITGDITTGDVEPIFRTGVAGRAEQGTLYIGKEVKGNNRRSFKLSGYIRDMETGRGLPNVAVIIRERGTGTATNDEGYYELQLPAGSSSAFRIQSE